MSSVDAEPPVATGSADLSVDLGDVRQAVGTVKTRLRSALRELERIETVLDDV